MICVKKDHRSFMDLASRLIQDIEEICRMARENDMSALLVADDIAGNKGLLFSKNDFAMTVQPLYEQIADIIKKNDLNAFFHSDGDTRGVIEPLIEAGYDCIHPIDSQAGLDLYALKDYYKGRVSFMGHIDIITWSDERIALEIKDAERMFETGGLILGSTCGLSMKTVSRKLNVLYPRWQSGGQRA
jgi:uroporphyrinogen-III decarboxylase